MPRKFYPLAALTTISGLSIVGCGLEDGDGYEARIRRTSYGVAHIEASNLANLGFGEGYAHAEDHLCSVADQIVMVRGERARYFGPGEGDANLLSDVGVKALGILEHASSDFRQQRQDLSAWYEGYAAGYNQYLEETGKDNVAGWCRGQDWVFPITAEELAAYHRRFALSIRPEMVARAQPPGNEEAAAAPAQWNLVRAAASNGWGLGKDLAESGRGMLLANPHYLWVGALRFWEKHLVIPGELNVYGAHILGFPGVAIGFNEAVGWTHTVSAGERITFYTLDLVPGKPTVYRYDGGEREMSSQTVTVEVLQEDGSLETVERTVYFSHHGPLVDFPGVGWTAERAVTARDANWDNDEAWRQWLDMNHARSLQEFQDAHAKNQGTAWVNTISTSAEGVAWYADTSATPNLSAEALKLWKQRREQDGLTKKLWQRGLVVLDGSDSTFEWVDDEGARDAEIVAYENMPRMERTDYVFNANDSFWLANSSALLEGSYSPLHGEQETPRSLRTRRNDLVLSNRAEDQPAGEDGKFSLEEVMLAVLSNRGLAAALLKAELVKRCRKNPVVKVDGARTDLREACEVLAGWDGRHDLDSRGAVLFREFMTLYEPKDLLRKGSLFAADFDPEAPVKTPHGLAPAERDGDLALQNLARAVRLLRDQNIALDVPLGDLQYANKPGRRIPIHGGRGFYEGVLNFVLFSPNTTTLEPLDTPEKIEGSRFLTKKGYPITHGTSFVMALEYTDRGPRAKALLTYGQSGDSESEHFFDQTLMFSKKQWRPVLFKEEEIAADTKREYTVRGSGR